jgi:uncharacterized protein
MTADPNQISAALLAHVQAWLGTIEAEEGVRVLYAAESGSRAWGFASPDSDYDVRFIYAHGPQWYTGLYDGRDVIERPLDSENVDLAGWDVKKALRLLLKSNPAFYEWLVSPIVYVDDGSFKPAAKALFERVVERSALANHYHSIATGQWNREIDGQEHVKLKKYFYIVRPLLSLQWVTDKPTMPPMRLQDLMVAIDMPPTVRRVIVELVDLKTTSPELGKRARLSELDQWILERLETLKPTATPNLSAPNSEQQKGVEDANALFRKSVGL